MTTLDTISTSTSDDVPTESTGWNEPQVSDYSTLFIPKNLADVNKINKNILDAGKDLHSDHPGFHDPVYRKRREELVDMATKYVLPKPIPSFEYNDLENSCWKTIWSELSVLSKTHAFSKYESLVSELGYGSTIPQLRDVNEWLLKKTGFRLCPTGGLLSSRDFLASLAFRTFQSTSYIRHPAKPHYTPEPDIVHEIIGHVPLLGDPEWAVFNQEIGLVSLGCSDEDIVRIARCYWYTVEFGLIKEGDGYRAIGAGLLSSYGELKHAVAEKPDIRKFDPFVAAEMDFPITVYQPILWYVDSISELITLFRKFSVTLKPVVKTDINAIRKQFAGGKLNMEQIVHHFSTASSTPSNSSGEDSK